MAYYFGITRGQNEYTVTSGATTTGKDIEIVINTNANVPSIAELLVGVENIENFVIRSGKIW